MKEEEEEVKNVVLKNYHETQGKKCWKICQISKKILDNSGTDRHKKGIKEIGLMTELLEKVSANKRSSHITALPFRFFTLNYQNYQKQPILSALCGC